MPGTDAGFQFDATFQSPLAALAHAIDRFDNVKAVVHGHAHRGAYSGHTPGGVPVFNCAQFVVEPEFGRPYALLEI